MKFASLFPARRVVLLALLSCLVLACDSDPAGPTAADLVGIWSNEDAGTTRAFVFEAPDDYTLYFYATGSAPEVAQVGTYAVTDGTLVTTVVGSPIDGGLVGRSFGNTIIDLGDDHLTIASPASATGERTFTRVDALE